MPIHPFIYIFLKWLLKTRKAKLITCIAKTNHSLGLILEENHMYKSFLFMTQHLL